MGSIEIRLILLGLVVLLRLEGILLLIKRGNSSFIRSSECKLFAKPASVQSFRSF